MKLPGIFVICTLIFQLAAAQTEFEIEKIADLPFAVSNNAVVEAFVNDTPFVYSFAGIDSTLRFSGIHLKSFRFNVFTRQVEFIPDLPDTLGKIAAAASRVGPIIYIIGGYHVFADGTERSSKKIHCFNPYTGRYFSDRVDLPIATDDQVQDVWRDSLIYVIGGWSDTGNIAQVQVFNPFTKSWKFGTALPQNSNFLSFGASGFIRGDTIFYFGGAAMGPFFPAQRQLRIGLINPADPYQIDWAFQTIDFATFAYRSAATLLDGIPTWIGGSNITYNYNALAYSNNQLVQPKHELIQLIRENGNTTWRKQNDILLPMDLRGVGNINSNEKILIGGIQSDGRVSAEVISIKKPVLTNIQASTESDKKVCFDLALRLNGYHFSQTSENQLAFKVFNIAGQNIYSASTNQSFIPKFNAGVYVVLAETNNVTACKVVVTP